MKAVVISTVGASNTGAGGPVGVYGNVACLIKSGYETFNVAICAKEAISMCEFQVLHITNENRTESSIANELKSHINRISPDVVWLHHYWVWKYYRSIASSYPFVLLSGDPDWELELLRYKTRAKNKNVLRRLYHYFLHVRTVGRLKKQEITIFNEVVRNYGVVACWCPSSIKDLQQRLSMKIHSCPLAFPDWGYVEGNISGGLLMLGNLNGGHSRLGVSFFLKSIWPKFKEYATKNNLKIRMVGGGKLPETLILPSNTDIFERVGFVEDLELEWKSALASLVTVPIELGFRTRIIESLSKGIPVVAHPSAKASLVELRDSENFLSFDCAEELVNKTTLLRSDPELYKYLVQNGRKMYLDYYSLNAGAIRFGYLSKMALSTLSK